MSHSRVHRYKAQQPKETHFRRGICEEAGCPHYLLGWKTLIDTATPSGRERADYIRYESERRFTEERGADSIIAFVFPAGQRCFRQHQVLLERPAVFSKDGRQLDGQDWIDDMKEGLYKIGRKIQAG